LLVKDNYFFAATYDRYLFISSDNAENWDKLDIYTYGFKSLGKYKNDIIAGSDYGQNSCVLISHNNGYKWGQMKVFNWFGFVSSILVLNNNIYVGSTQGGVFISSDGGNNWTPDEAQCGGISSLANKGDNIFAGSWGYGIYLFNGNNNSLTTMNSGLTNKNILALTIKDSIMFAGTYGGGIFRTNLSYFGIVDIKENIIKSDQLKIFPNPASDYIEITGMEALSSPNENIRIYNILGECIKTVEQTTPSVQLINISELSPGIYFVRVGNQTKMFIKE
jgi:hypothetical protein